MSSDYETASLPQLQHIRPAPRYLPLSAKLYLRLCSTVTPLFGWIFAGIGFGFALILPITEGLDGAIPRIWVDSGKGTVISVTDVNFHINDKKIFAYHFETGNQKIISVSYGYKDEYKTGDNADIQKSGWRYRIKGQSLSRAGFFPLIFVGAGCFFGVIGLCFPIYSWFASGKAIHLLQDGTAIGAKYIGMNPTGMRVGGGRHGGGKPVMKVDFEYQVDVNTYTASAQVLDTSRLTDSGYKVVLYDPLEPKRAVILDGLPSGIRLDDLTGEFYVNPLRIVFPLFAATIVSAEILAVIVFIIIAI
ncbi:MAG: hypothetical protein FWE67_04945 [Planctomycetaceae bacterium]|nr:hypothetical protein [Planctomycetaceae bacterium]